ncbi:hypothetical protein F4821DRAFT_231506 [Hypoxylon rubiginosum]|uniref:Uncharacterized protein n=1 Tax=Hypoxylon rubiginosum TaxID=110542 RepID=A0ACC0D984_9PEZI|nr:hypothetical protein F4821DRAFT_231506 [Hypoxylon rubiginosum]
MIPHLILQLCLCNVRVAETPSSAKDVKGRTNDRCPKPLPPSRWRAIPGRSPRNMCDPVYPRHSCVLQRVRRKLRYYFCIEMAADRACFLPRARSKGDMIKT